MQYTLVSRLPDAEAFGELLRELDPAAFVDVKDGEMRISSFVHERELAELLERAGVERPQLRRMPSECCGGCGG